MLRIKSFVFLMLAAAAVFRVSRRLIPVSVKLIIQFRLQITRWLLPIRRGLNHTTG